MRELGARQREPPAGEPARQAVHHHQERFVGEAAPLGVRNAIGHDDARLAIVHFELAEPAMTDLSDIKRLASYRPTHKVRFVTAASLFDGHDASINIMRRILQGMGCEVIHLGHNRSVEEIVTAAVQEDVQGIAVSSYQGGHVEFFKYMIDLLRSRGGEHIKVFGGGGGVIVPAEIKELHDYGVARIFSPEDGQKLGLQGMIGSMVAACDLDLSVHAPASVEALRDADLTRRWRALAQAITALEAGSADAALVEAIRKAADLAKVPTLGITGTGGAGKSSLTDELIRRFRLDQGDALSIAVISIDPSRRKSGGALLGDRIRMNAINAWSDGPKVYMRSLATREAGSEISEALPDAVAACKCAGFDLVLVETSGIGQGDAAIVPHVDATLYVMTPEYGAASQLEKIDMLDFADFVAINKFDRKGAAGRAARCQQAGAAEQGRLFQAPGRDAGVRHHGRALQRRRRHRAVPLAAAAPEGAGPAAARVAAAAGVHPPLHPPDADRPPNRTRYLAEISETVRGYKQRAVTQARLARERQQLLAAKEMLASSPRRRPGPNVDANSEGAGMTAPSANSSP
jgi:isobutyryl-CoA mutase